MSAPGTSDVEFDEEFDPDAAPCWKCGGEGTIIICCDDMCHGQGFCMHGDGEITCPECKGNG